MMEMLRALALCAALAGCAHPKPPPAAPHAVAAPAPEPPRQHGERGADRPVPLPHRIVDQPGTSVEETAFPDRLRAARVIYVGEQHTSPHDHAAELEVLERVFAADPSVGIGIEMLPRTLQPALDAWLAGELDEAAFLEKVEWKKTWGYAFGLYAPLLRFCKAHKLRGFALNAPREIVRALAHGDELTPEQKQLLPDMVPGPAAHRELVREAWGGHPHGRFADARFERFYRAQLLWDETMADRVAAALTGPGAPKRLVVFAGEAHVRRFAVPDRAARRGARPYLTILPVLEADLADARADNSADLYWVLEMP